MRLILLNELCELQKGGRLYVLIPMAFNNNLFKYRQKLQIGTFEGNPILAQFPRFGRGNVGEISLKNGSTIYITTDHNQYKHVEGKSLSHVMLDEAQYQDIQHFDRVVMTLMQTHGKITVCGITAPTAFWIYGFCWSKDYPLGPPLWIHVLGSHM